LRTRIVITGEEPDYNVTYKYGVDRKVEDIPFLVLIEIECEEDWGNQQSRNDKQRHHRLPKYST